jgi:hypothetical protein
MSNPYEEEKEEKQALVEIESSRAIAEVQGQVVMAKKFPRDPVVAMDRILNECRRETLAEQAQYQFPRGGTMVTGPSIRLAETIARNWGNLSFGVTEVERKGQESQMLAYAWDLETNVMARQEFKVRHLRDTREGLKPLRDERDVYEITANQAARRLRSCILRVIPGDVVDGALEECSKTLAAKVGNVQERIPGMLEKFKELGISKLQIEKRLRHRIESLNGPELLSLIKIYNSIKDGMSSVDDYFEPEQKEQPAKEDPAQVAAAMVEKIKARVKKQEPAPDVAIESKSYQEAEVKMSELPDDELPIF